VLLTIGEHNRLAKFARDRGTSVSELIRAQIQALLGQAEE
jgi:hypothetical protein